nr:MAG TPA: hypothetical protein [Caudoviricetes sp.]
MEEKAFLIKFTAKVALVGDIHINAANEEEAEFMASQIIKRNLDVEDCMIELGSENNNDDFITVKEIQLNTCTTATTINDIMPL